MADYGQFEIGNVDYPLNVSGSVLQAINPPLYYALDYFVAMLQQHLGTAWDGYATVAGLADLDGYIVRTALPYDPTPDLLTQQVQLPLFALWEDEGIIEGKSLTWFHSVTSWKAVFVLPPLTSAQKEILHPFLKGAVNVLYDRTIQGHDPSYMNNLVLWDKDVSGIEKIRLTKFRFDNFSIPSSNQFMPTVIMNFDVSIRQDSNSSFFQSLGGVDTTIQVEDLDLIQTKLDF